VPGCGTTPSRSPFAKSDRGRFLAEVSVALDATLDVEEIAGAAVRAAVPRIADVALIWLLQGDGPALCRFVHARRELLSFMARDRTRVVESLPHSHPVSVVLRSGEAMWADAGSIGLDALARDPGQLARLRAIAPTTWLLVPLVDRGHVLGALMLVTTAHVARRFRPADVAYGRDLAQRIAAAVAHAHEYGAVRAKVQTLALQLAEQRRAVQAGAAVACNARGRGGSPEHTRSG
jgi:GAF domain-containing protein